MKKTTKIIIYLTLSLGFFLIPLQNAEAARINSSIISSPLTYVGGNISGTAEICLRGPGNAFTYNPAIVIARWYPDGSTSFIKRTSLSPGKCTSFNSGSYGPKTYQVHATRTSGIKNYYFDLHN